MKWRDGAQAGRPRLDGEEDDEGEDDGGEIGGEGGRTDGRTGEVEGVAGAPVRLTTSAAASIDVAARPVTVSVALRASAGRRGCVRRGARVCLCVCVGVCACAAATLEHGDGRCCCSNHRLASPGQDGHYVIAPGRAL